MVALFKAEVRIALKKGVTDPEGKNTHKALELLGFKDVKGVQAERLYAIEISAPNEAEANRQAEEMCRKLLANPVIHEYSVSLERVR